MAHSPLNNTIGFESEQSCPGLEQVHFLCAAKVLLITIIIIINIIVVILNLWRTVHLKKPTVAELINMLCFPKADYCAHKSLSLDSALNLLYPVYPVISVSFKSTYYSSLTYTQLSLEVQESQSRYCHGNPVRLSYLMDLAR
jgi:hypothetical protein